MALRQKNFRKTSPAISTNKPNPKRPISRRNFPARFRNLSNKKPTYFDGPLLAGAFDSVFR
jgi:hypothetical protein